MVNMYTQVVNIYLLLALWCMHQPEESSLAQLLAAASPSSSPLSTVYSAKTAMYFTGTTTYSARKFDIIELSKWFN